MPFEKSAAHSGADAVTEGKDALTLPEKEVVGYNAPQDKVVAGFQESKVSALRILYFFERAISICADKPKCLRR